MAKNRSLFDYIKDYKKYVYLNVISNILMVIFSVVSIPALIPFLTLLFNRDVDSL